MSEETEVREAFKKLLDTAPRALSDAMLAASAEASHETEGVPTLGETFSAIAFWVGELIRNNTNEDTREQVLVQVANAMSNTALREEVPKETH